MKNAHRICAVVSLLLLSVPALACSWPTYTPQQKYKAHTDVVLAYPISIVTEPKNALTSKLSNTFKQTIQWQVLVSWKGRYRPGDILLTRISYQSSNVCGDQAQRDRVVMLLHLNGQEPHDVMIGVQPHKSIDEMKYLSQRQRGG